MTVSDSGKQLRFGGLRWSAAEGGLVNADGEPVALRPQSLAVFCELMQRPGEIVPKKALFDAVWPHAEVTDDSLVQCVADIRRALGDAGHRVLLTVPRRGYRLLADPEEPEISEASVISMDGAESPISVDTALISNIVDGEPGHVETAAAPKRRPWPGVPRPLAWVWALAGFAAVAFIAAAMIGPETAPPLAAAPVPHEPVSAAETGVSALAPVANPYVPAVAIERRDATGIDRVDDAQRDRGLLLDAFTTELRAALHRYKTIRLVDQPSPDTDYRLVVDARPADGERIRLTVEAIDGTSRAVFLSRSADLPANAHQNAELLRTKAIRIAAFASPAGGALSRHLMASAFHKPVDKLTRAECYAHGYDCASCSGGVEMLSARTKACLNRLLEDDPNDPAAWALKAGLHAHQYRWGAALDEPERTDLPARAYLKAHAIDAATRAETLSDGTLPVVYWDMAHAYHASCDIDKMRTAIERGLALNPDDPGMLGMFGTLLAYSGSWDEGVAMVERAIAIDPDHARPWWHFVPAKRKLVRGDLEGAMAGLRKAYEAQNWSSHVSYAYTLALLGRLDEARESARQLQRVLPGFTIEKVLQFYQQSCFPDNYLEMVRTGLRLAGMPSRGESARLDRIRPVAARMMPVNGTRLEYIDLGKGEPVLFLPGGMSDYRTWAYYEVPMSERHRYISYTQRFFGTQPWPPDGPNPGFETYADDLIAFIEALDAGPVHLIGWSFSGRVAMAAMAQRPDLFKSAVLYEPSARNLLTKEDQASDGMKIFSARFASVGERAKAGDMQQALANMVDAVFEREAGGFFNETSAFQRVGFDNARTLAFGGVQSPLLSCEYIMPIKVPTLVVKGGETGFFFSRIAERSVECLGNARLTVLPGVKHDGPVRKVDEFGDLIRAHVDRYTVADRAGLGR